MNEYVVKSFTTCILRVSSRTLRVLQSDFYDEYDSNNFFLVVIFIFRSKHKKKHEHDDDELQQQCSLYNFQHSRRRKHHRSYHSSNISHSSPSYHSLHSIIITYISKNGTTSSPQWYIHLVANNGPSPSISKHICYIHDYIS